MLYCLYYQYFTILIGNFDSLVLVLLIQKQLISEFMMLDMEAQHTEGIYLWWQENSWCKWIEIRIQHSA